MCTIGSLTIHEEEGPLGTGARSDPEWFDDSSIAQCTKPACSTCFHSGLSSFCVGVPAFQPFSPREVQCIVFRFYFGKRTVHKVTSIVGLIWMHHLLSTYWLPKSMSQLNTSCARKDVGWRQRWHQHECSWFGQCQMLEACAWLQNEPTRNASEVGSSQPNHPREDKPTSFTA